MNKIARTYQFSPDLITAIDAACIRNNVNSSDLVAKLIEYGINKLQRGELSLITKVPVNTRFAIESLYDESDL